MAESSIKHWYFAASMTENPTAIFAAHRTHTFNSWLYAPENRICQRSVRVRPSRSKFCPNGFSRIHAKAATG